MLHWDDQLLGQICCSLTSTSVLLGFINHVFSLTWGKVKILREWCSLLCYLSHLFIYQTIVHPVKYLWKHATLLVFYLDVIFLVSSVTHYPSVCFRNAALSDCVNQWAISIMLQFFCRLVWMLTQFRLLIFSVYQKTNSSKKHIRNYQTSDQSNRSILFFLHPLCLTYQTIIHSVKILWKYESLLVSYLNAIVLVSSVRSSPVFLGSFSQCHHARIFQTGCCSAGG